eukprot:9096544-Alexandrium_andersonii.AAC.1
MERIRQAASQSFFWLDSQEAIRKGLQCRSRPPRVTCLTPGAEVYFFPACLLYTSPSPRD